MAQRNIHIIGAGLAGCEAAFFLAERGVHVCLHEMRPARQTPAHQTGDFAELVCSNSLKSRAADSAPGTLKEELKLLGSLVISVAEKCAIPAGEALGVDRKLFSEAITHALRRHPKITVIEEEVVQPVSGAINVIATGPLTSDHMVTWLKKHTSSEELYFYDAIAPIVDAASVDTSVAYFANRYDKGGEVAYLNCPFNEEEYVRFVAALQSAETVTPRAFEKPKYFQGCQPIEAISVTGLDSLRFGPMRPVGLVNPKDRKIPHAVVQLRPENSSCTSYNLVGFQTKLTYPEQKRVLRLIPGLEKVEFLRLGSIHRNTYVCAPAVLRPDLSLRGNPLTYLAGQITGVEGYVESAACGLLAGIFVWQRLRGAAHSAPPANTALGALLRHLATGDEKNFQPSGIHFGLFDSAFFDLQGIKGKNNVRAAMTRQCIDNLSRCKMTGAILSP